MIIMKRLHILNKNAVWKMCWLFHVRSIHNDTISGFQRVTIVSKNHGYKNDLFNGIQHVTSFEKLVMDKRLFHTLAPCKSFLTKHQNCIIPVIFPGENSVPRCMFYSDENDRDKIPDYANNGEVNLQENPTQTEGPGKVKKNTSKTKQTKQQPVSSNNLSPIHMKPVNTTEIKDYFTKNEIGHSDGFTCYISTCPRFIRRRMKMKEMNKLFINKKTGYFVCLSCKKSGSWSDLMDNSDMILSIDRHGRLPECFKDMVLEDQNKEAEKAEELWDACLMLDSVSDEELESLQHMLKAEALTRKTLNKYNIRIQKDKNGIALPQYGLDGNIIGVKMIVEEIYKVKDADRSRIVTRTTPRVDFHGLFGMNLIKPSNKELVLTADEFDAMAVYQATGVPALALPKKDSILPQKVLPTLEQFQKIILWFGGDVKMWESAKQFCRKLNETRCYLVRPDEKHPNALNALDQELDLLAILRETKPVQHKSITSFRNLRHDVLAELTQYEQVAGVKWKRYTQLNKLLKGHRRGELSIFTGPTGSGKTTFISDYSLDLCTQGVNTLWGSFEINNVRLMKTMLFQYSQINLVKNIEKFDHWADKFEQLPMYYMTFHGQENVRKVIETMSHAVYVHDIAHVIVDNLQFMMGVDDFSSGQKMAIDRFYKQDQIIGAFRKFATNMNCHVTLVIHPRKERETDELNISSIFGSAKASQEADNIMIIQDRRAVSLRGRKYLQLAKNRYDGELGIMMLKFDKETLSFVVKTRDKDEKDKDKKHKKSASTSDTVPQGLMPQYNS